MKKILLTLGLTLGAIAMSFNGISQSTAANTNKAETLEVVSKCKKDCKKACCTKSESKSKKSCAAKCSKSKTSAVAGIKQEAKVIKAKSCTKGKKACCKSKMNKSEPKLEKRPTKIKAN